MAEGQLKLVVDNPTEGATDGILASQSLQAYPVNVIINTGTANSTLFKCAIRCDVGWKTVGNWEISFTGTNASKWKVADGTGYITEEMAEFATYASSLTSNTVVDNKNHILWLKASTDGSEAAQVDTSVQIRVYGRCVPS